MFDSPHRFLDLPAARVATWTVGQGPDLVFVHGWPFWSATYRDLVPRLSDRFACHLLDLPGAGKTETRDRSAIDLRRHVDTVGEAVDALGLTRYAMLGFDSGGMIARAVAARRPEQATAMVLGNTEMPGHMSPLFRRFLRMGRTRAGRAALIAAMRVPALRRSQYGMGTCFMDTSLVDGEFTSLFIEPILRSAVARDGTLAALETIDPDFPDELAEIHAAMRCPVQLIWGDRDPWFKLSGAQACLPEFPAGAELAVLEGKLMVHEERPERFAEIAGAFLERVHVT